MISILSYLFIGFFAVFASGLLALIIDGEKEIKIEDVIHRLNRSGYWPFILMWFFWPIVLSMEIWLLISDYILRKIGHVIIFRKKDD